MKQELPTRIDRGSFKQLRQLIKSDKRDKRTLDGVIEEAVQAGFSRPEVLDAFRASLWEFNNLYKQLAK